MLAFSLTAGGRASRMSFGRTRVLVGWRVKREKALMLTHQELPYSTGVVVESIEEEQKGEQTLVRIHATIYVERLSQKIIVIGRNGQMLKRIGTLAREDMEAMLGLRVFLQLFVKVREKWTENKGILNRMGL